MKKLLAAVPLVIALGFSAVVAFAVQRAGLGEDGAMSVAATSAAATSVEAAPAPVRMSQAVDRFWSESASAAQVTAKYVGGASTSAVYFHAQLMRRLNGFSPIKWPELQVVDPTVPRVKAMGPVDRSVPEFEFTGDYIRLRAPQVTQPYAAQKIVMNGE